MTDSQPEPSDSPSEPHEALSDAELEEMLLTATQLPGRRALAAVTAIRTILQRRAQRRRADGFDADHAEALGIVNEVRGPGRQLTELHQVDVASVMADPGWAELVASDEEIREASGEDVELLG